LDKEEVSPLTNEEFALLKKREKIKNNTTVMESARYLYDYLYADPQTQLIKENPAPKKEEKHPEKIASTTSQVEKRSKKSFIKMR